MESTQTAQWVESTRILINRIIFLGMSAEDILEDKKTIRRPAKDRLHNINAKIEENAEGTLVVNRYPTRDILTNAEILGLIAQLVFVYNPEVPECFKFMELGLTREKAGNFVEALFVKGVTDVPQAYKDAWMEATNKPLDAIQPRLQEKIAFILAYYDERFNEIKEYDANRKPRGKQTEPTVEGEF